MAIAADALMPLPYAMPMRWTQEAANRGAGCHGRHLPPGAGPRPATFWEALQYYWFVHVGVITELNPWDAFNPGRLDQHLYPFYERELAAGSLTRSTARELLSGLLGQVQQPPGAAQGRGHAKESNTYTDFANINLGGVTRDGSDAVNELTYLILDVIEEMRLLQPSSMVQLSKKNPDRFLRRALEIVRTGFGQPSIFNTDAIVQELVRQGKIRRGRPRGRGQRLRRGRRLRQGGLHPHRLLQPAQSPRAHPQQRRRSAHRQARSGRRPGPADLRRPSTALRGLRPPARHFVDIKIRGNNIIERHLRQVHAGAVSLAAHRRLHRQRPSTTTPAARATTRATSRAWDLGTVTDSLSALKHHVFDEGRHHGRMLAALARRLRRATRPCGRPPRDTPSTATTTTRRRDHGRSSRPTSTRWTAGPTPGAASTASTCCPPPATSTSAGDRRPARRPRAGAPLSEGISPVQGADRNGPTAVLKSAAKIDHLRTGGTLLNQKVLPQVLADEAGIDQAGPSGAGYFRWTATTSSSTWWTAETLRKAQNDPDRLPRSDRARGRATRDYFRGPDSCRRRRGRRECGPV
jgi:hypothetical protein